MPREELLLKAVLELWEGLRSQTCKTWSCTLGDRVRWASCACGDTWGAGTNSREVLGGSEAAWLVLPWAQTGAFSRSRAAWHRCSPCFPERFPLVWGCEEQGSS